MKITSRALIAVGIVLGLVMGIAFLTTRSKHLTPMMGYGKPPVVHPQMSEAINRTTPDKQGIKPMRVQKGAVVTADTVNWARKYGASVDYFDFVRSAASAALQGDGRAAFYVKEVLGECADVMALAKRIGDPKQAFQKSVDYPYTPPWALQAQLARFQRCIHLAQDDAFATLPDHKGAYPYEYWKHLALEEHDPVAEANQASEDYLNLSAIKSAESKEKSLDQIRMYVNDAVASKDPEAIFAIGAAMAFGSFQKDASRGLAMALAACDMGMDCTANNPQQRFWNNCVASGKCGANTTFPDTLQTMVGAEQYGHIYMLAQEFKDSLSRNDWSDLKNYVSFADKK